MSENIAGSVDESTATSLTVYRRCCQRLLSKWFSYRKESLNKLSPLSLVVLQKHEEKPQEQSFGTLLLLCLHRYSKQFSDECRLSQAVPFAYALHLSFPQHVDGFIPLQCSPGRLKREKAHAWFDQSFDEAVVLFNQVVEVLGERFLTLTDGLGYLAE